MGTLRQKLTKPIHGWARKALPSLSDTEREALEAGDVWWEGELFSGNPDWSKLQSVKAPELSAAEQAFIDGPCRELCAMIDDWKINQEDADLPPEVWDFLRVNRFFGMIIPEAYGGLGFSAYAHSVVVRFLSTRSVAVAVTVMVPNSLGPGELLMQFGTEAQKDHWLPRLARGDELPAFGLTSAEAGSDASAMADEGIVCKGEWNGEEVLGIRLNWSKRYITLAPVCTVLGLAFKMRDPDRLLGGDEDIGITCALVPTDLEGVETGRRHLPSSTMFMNGPTTGEDVFIPLDNIIGGQDCAGHGWTMLMSALAAGRGISLPSMGCAAIALSAHTTGAYARIRQQFNLPIGKFGGIQARLGRLAADAYAMDAARNLTCAGLDEGRALSVISAIMKTHATFRMRDALNDAMDVHSGKAVIDGPSNYLLPFYRAVPIGITVEGANIVTRSLIIFGQGSIRAHPHMLDNIQALGIADDEESLRRFDESLWAHIGHTTRTFFRAWGRAWTGGRFAPAPANAGPLAPIYRQLSRWSAAYALTADFAFLTMGGALKRKEMISGRMGDILSEMYILSATLKRWEDEGRQEADLPVVRFAAARGFRAIHEAMDGVLANFPARWAAWVLRFFTLAGRAPALPDDRLTEECSDLIYTPSESRDRIVGHIFEGCHSEGIELLNRCYAAVTGAAPLMKKLRDLGKTPQEAHEAGVLSDADITRLNEMDALVAEVVAVDDYTPEALSKLFPGLRKPAARAAE
ncbi:acyl-CoA dehydrogenase [Roseovarius halotolerans]|uniref:Acyl-coenzyme A dehydrogenase n=1 Tax=Roseovarius halotolerans TaxID=505353 RepID=A0A1X6YWG2_9RHOB|nr:acyl-CoA dehydrogenase [Roseovarius halotolerans]RKT32793.1 acyl-CoA dehydrogenase [Roseovarius halotolerans]SLN32541.1 Acyl-coenzyme A dehydrogenase [Roseovarius halotolerans]